MVSASHLYCPNCGKANQPQAKFCAQCGQSFQGRPRRHTTVAIATAEPPVSAPLLKQRYQILEQIGKGGFGVVYKAQDTAFANRLVAIKEMQQEHIAREDSAAAAEAFKREAFLLAALTHPNLPSIYDHFSEDERWYLVMTFIEGETLGHYLETTPEGCLPVREVVEIALQLCSVLDYLHNRQPPIIFRDLKPANIMRTPQGQLYLIDFGIARHFKPGQRQDTRALGSPGYAAPEQYGKAQTTPQTDIYSLGATLHCLLSGIDPAESPFAYLSRRLAAPPELSTLILRMLDNETAKRPNSVAEVKQELQRFIALYPALAALPDSAALPNSASKPIPPQMPVTPPIPVTPPMLLEVPQRFTQPALGHMSARARFSRRALIVGIVGLASLGSIATGVVAQALQTPESTLSPIVTPQVVFQRSPLFPSTLPLNALLSVAWSPSGHAIATASGDGTVHVWQADLSSILHSYHPHHSSVSALAWSPEGNRLATASYDSTLCIFESGTGATRHVYHGSSSPVLAVAWSPDGKRIAASSYDHTVRIWDVARATTSMSYTAHTEQVSAVAWSPDGKYIASGGADTIVRVWDAVSGTTISSYTGHIQPIEAVAWSPDGNSLASASDDSTVQVWEALTGRTLYTYRGHSDQVWAVAWSSDGAHVASGSWDKTAQVWDAATGERILTYTGHANDVLSLTWSPDSRHIASGDADGKLQVWHVG